MNVKWIVFTTEVLFLALNVHAFGKLITSKSIFNTRILIILGEIEKCFKFKYAANIHLNDFFCPSEKSYT